MKNTKFPNYIRKIGCYTQGFYQRCVGHKAAPILLRANQHGGAIPEKNSDSNSDSGFIMHPVYYF